MKHFLSCDWGTSAFRLRLIEAESFAVIEEENTKQGIAETFQLWTKTGKRQDERLAFYLDIISSHIKTIEEKTGNNLDSLPLVISGMASSTIGMVDLPYKDLPFSTGGEDLEKMIIEQPGKIKQNVVIISGVRSENDVIRGEETKLVGCANTNDQIYTDTNDHTYIFPGTHPKHVYVKANMAIAFETYMTGEFFELLSMKSILSVSVKKSKGLETERNLRSFREGVNESLRSNLLHSCFLVRTNQLFKKFTEEENYFYLSGLLIGTELNALSCKSQHITIAANDALSAQYKTALEILELPEEGAAISTMDADEALIKGQWEVFKKVENIHKRSKNL
jgi:2-dehydro-3-deoxygalactonokinase